MERNRAGRHERGKSERETFSRKPFAGEQPVREPDENLLEGRNAVLEAFRAGRTVERLYVQEGLKDGPILSILREQAKHPETILERVPKSRLDQLSTTGAHQGVIARVAAFAYAQVDDILEAARRKGEDPFIVLLDGVEDPHNLGAIIRTANLAGAHGVILPKRRSAGLSAAAVRASAGAVHHTPVARVTNLGTTIDDLKKEGLVREIGVSNFDPMKFDVLNKAVDGQLVTNQIEWNPVCFEHFNSGMMDYLTYNKIHPLIWSPMAGGRLFKGGDELCEKAMAKIREIADRHNADPQTIIYAWIMYHPVGAIPLSGSQQLFRLDLAIKALDIKLEHYEWYEIYTASGQQVLR